MRTDMLSHSSRCWRAFDDGTASSLHAAHAAKVQNKILSATRLTAIYHQLDRKWQGANRNHWLMSEAGTDRLPVHCHFVKATG
jgi:hypothetical protein